MALVRANVEGCRLEGYVCEPLLAPRQESPLREQT